MRYVGADSTKSYRPHLSYIRQPGVKSLLEKLLLATGNRGKIHELSRLLCDDHWVLTTPAAEGVDITVDETGRTFEENATLKASAYAQASRLVAIADDSGLEVEALHGEPGVHSARYAGDKASDEDKVKLLLKNLSGVPLERRQARFRCVMAVAFPEGGVELFKGECPGVIVFDPRGKNGFGYDPVFFVPEFSRTMAELSDKEKNSISHRGRAAVQARRFLLARLQK